jgi:hypothetical protein
MRAARARADAATSLRLAARARLGDSLAIGPEAPPAALIEAIAARTGRRADDVKDLLFGGVPPEDKTLVALANALDDLEDAVRHP